MDVLVLVLAFPVASRTFDLTAAPLHLPPQPLSLSSDRPLDAQPRPIHCSSRGSSVTSTHISAAGIEANSDKVERILNWPVPKSATDVRAFLGLVRYIMSYLPQLAEHTRVLTPSTKKEFKTQFPPWTDELNLVFESIKKLVVSRECLTVIDHNDPGENKIFVTTDVSDWRTGAVLSFGATWETAQPVVFDSMQLKGAELNYLVHEKELLAIIRALKKWRMDLMGANFVVYTDHRTLENFNVQRDLSRRQLR